MLKNNLFNTDDVFCTLKKIAAGPEYMQMYYLKCNLNVSIAGKPSITQTSQSDQKKTFRIQISIATYYYFCIFQYIRKHAFYKNKYKQ